MGCREIRLGGNRCLIVYCSEKRAGKDRHERMVALEKLKKKFSASSDIKRLAAGRGYARLLKIRGARRLRLARRRWRRRPGGMGLEG